MEKDAGGTGEGPEEGGKGRQGREGDRQSVGAGTLQVGAES